MDAEPDRRLTPWACAYRGLWGLYAQDPISGENAPAGPMYNRDGSPRSSWFDPLGFAELDQVPPPPQELRLLESECAKLEARQEELATLIPQEAETLQKLGIRLESMEGRPHLATQFEQLELRVAALAAKVKALRREQSENERVLEGLQEPARAAAGRSARRPARPHPAGRTAGGARLSSASAAPPSSGRHSASACSWSASSR